MSADALTRLWWRFRKWVARIAVGDATMLFNVEVIRGTVVAPAHVSTQLVKVRVEGAPGAGLQYKEV